MTRKRRKSSLSKIIFLASAGLAAAGLLTASIASSINRQLFDAQEALASVPDAMNDDEMCAGLDVLENLNRSARPVDRIDYIANNIDPETANHMPNSSRFRALHSLPLRMTRDQTRLDALRSVYSNYTYEPAFEAFFARKMLNIQDRIRSDSVIQTAQRQWENYSSRQRQAILTRIVNHVSDGFSLPRVSVEFNNLPTQYGGAHSNARLCHSTELGRYSTRRVVTINSFIVDARNNRVQDQSNPNNWCNLPRSSFDMAAEGAIHEAVHFVTHHLVNTESRNTNTNMPTDINFQTYTTLLLSNMVAHYVQSRDDRALYREQPVEDIAFSAQTLLSNPVEWRQEWTERAERAEAAIAQRESYQAELRSRGRIRCNNIS